MTAQCNTGQLEFQPFKNKKVTGSFNGGEVSSSGGLMLIREAERQFRVLDRFAECFTDLRDPARAKHSVLSMAAQRICGIIAGYEDINDHDELRADGILKMCCGSSEQLAGKSTLNRLELTPEDADSGDRYKKIVADFAAMDDLMVDIDMDFLPFIKTFLYKFSEFCFSRHLLCRMMSRNRLQRFFELPVKQLSLAQHNAGDAQKAISHGEKRP